MAANPGGGANGRTGKRLCRLGGGGTLPRIGTLDDRTVSAQACSNGLPLPPNRRAGSDVIAGSLRGLMQAA